MLPKPNWKQWGDRELFWLMLALVALIVWGSNTLLNDPVGSRDTKQIVTILPSPR
jgi:drug/metabolite transporter (DMT)-like permease